MDRNLLKGTFALMAGSLLLLGASVRADCVYPKAPSSIPDGSVASETEMTAAASVFKQYNNDVTAYLSCLQDETATKSAGVSTSQAMQIKSMQSKKHNSAVEELEASVAKFNAQLRAFKARKA